MPTEPTILDHVSDEDRRALVALSTRRRYRRNEVVFHQGDVGDSLHLVLHGAFLVHLAAAGGAEIVPRLVGAGDLFGEFALFSGTGRRASTVTALAPAETRVIDAMTFDAIRRRNPGLDRYLVEMLSRRSIQMSHLLLEAYFKPVDTRVSRRLLELDRHAEPDASGNRWIHISQRDLAALAGTTRPTVNRVLQRAAERGWIEVARGRIHVADQPALRQSAA